MVAWKTPSHLLSPFCGLFINRITQYGSNICSYVSGFFFSLTVFQGSSKFYFSHEIKFHPVVVPDVSIWQLMESWLIPTVGLLWLMPLWLSAHVRFLESECESHSPTLLQSFYCTKRVLFHGIVTVEPLPTFQVRCWCRHLVSVGLEARDGPIGAARSEPLSALSVSALPCSPSCICSCQLGPHCACHPHTRPPFSCGRGETAHCLSPKHQNTSWHSGRPACRRAGMRKWAHQGTQESQQGLGCVCKAKRHSWVYRAGPFSRAEALLGTAGQLWLGQRRKWMWRWLCWEAWQPGCGNCIFREQTSLPNGPVVSFNSLQIRIACIPP